MPTTATFTADLWEYPGQAAWHFVTLPPEVGDDLREAAAGPRRGFGSLRVRVTVGGSTWDTSVFPSKELGFLLPVKAAVRRAEDLLPGDPVEVQLVLRDS